MSVLKLWRIPELAEYLRISPSSVYNIIKRGWLPHCRVGRSIRFSKDVIDKWIAERDGHVV